MGNIISVSYTHLEPVFVIDGGEQPPLLKYKKLEEIPWIRHCFTTREGGASKGIFAELNLSFTRGDEEAAVRENYRRVAKRMVTEVSQDVYKRQGKYRMSSAMHSAKQRRSRSRH